MPRSIVGILVVLIFSGFAGFVTSEWMKGNKFQPKEVLPNVNIVCKDKKFSLQQFNNCLPTGTSLSAVNELFGFEGDLVVSSGDSETYSWVYLDGKSVSIVFVNKRSISKAQMNLD